MRHHLFVAIPMVVEVVDQGIYRGQPCLGEHRVGTIALAHVIEPLAHRLLIRAGSKHRQYEEYRYDIQDMLHDCKGTQ
ncbi:MAG: hypothetical protein II431_13610 [Prevotella sp.]|nr:hypothetical protein [Prevotella sp.]